MLFSIVFLLCSLAVAKPTTPSLDDFRLFHFSPYSLLQKRVFGYDEKRVCTVYVDSDALYVAMKNVNIYESTAAFRLEISQSNCSKIESCFFYNGFTYLVVKNKRNGSKMISAHGEMPLALNYDLMRYDSFKKKIYYTYANLIYSINPQDFESLNHKLIPKYEGQIKNNCSHFPCEHDPLDMQVVDGNIFHLNGNRMYLNLEVIITDMNSSIIPFIIFK